MYDRILVPLDGSPLAEQVLPYVSRISLGLGIPVHLFQVLDAVNERLADPAHGLYTSAIAAGFHACIAEIHRRTAALLALNLGALPADERLTALRTLGAH